MSASEITKASQAQPPATAPTRVSVTLEPADIFLTRGASILSRLIRLFTRTLGEKRTKVNHSGVVVTGGSLETAEVIEALSKVEQHRLWDRYADSGDEVAVYRLKDLTERQAKTVVDKAVNYKGYIYGWKKLITHFLDWLLLGAYVFRRLALFDKYPICSWVVAYSFDKIHWRFGVPPSAASPDDISDHIDANPDAYIEVLPLTRIGRFTTTGS